MTLIEWVKNPDGNQGYTWNPITGCLNHFNGLCKGGNFPCYAYRLAHGRLRERYLDNINFPKAVPRVLDPFYPRFWPERLLDGRDELCASKPRGIFLCDMGELFGDWVPREWQDKIFSVIKSRPQHRFYLLTKQPQNLPAWSPFPDNVWLGVSATNQHQFDEAVKYLKEVKAAVKYVSFEPLLERITEYGTFS